ncbi:TetR/AcrR family transcriptional regulator [Secundilactobacillus kimchicus]|uniref:TetR/AcrR family transcriptional regulator n=1 Tax=Secundilactobacillus kimchicus TaxID=528209 RepID=UPI0006D26CD1|nr:TetR family transcriptional regulator [Secundilactobacillus kimchicus]
MKNGNKRLVKKILDVATRRFMHHGVKATSIAEIAKMAGVSQVTLYKHYKNKETLARAAVIKLIDDGYRQDLKILADTTLTFKEKNGSIDAAKYCDIKRNPP